MSKFLFISLFIILALPKTAFAERPPVPQNKKDAMESVQTRLKESQKTQKELRDNVNQIESNLDKTKKEMVQVAQDIQKNEKELSYIAHRTKKLEERENEIAGSLSQERDALADLVLALNRIRRVPPEALLARPGAPLKTAQTAMLLRDVIPTIHDRAEDLRVKLEELEATQSELAEKRDFAERTAKRLKEKHENLSNLVDKRQKLYIATRASYIQQQKSVQKLSQNAKNLQDLVEELEQNRRRLNAQKLKRRTTFRKPQEVPIPKAGQPRLPVAGTIRIGYNDRDDFGAKSKGLTISTARNALVIAPMAGIVRFAGPFKRFGNMVVIEHEKGYHSLVAGFEKIDTIVGHSVGAGEPLGFLPKYKSGTPPSLYYELRHKGKPINPARRFPGLG